MNQKNFEYLRDQVKYTGFGEGLEKELKEKMEKQTPEFTLTHQGNFGNDMTASVLNFKRSAQSDMYFFNSYKMSLKKEDKPEIMSQTFYINKSNNITMKEAYNLMSGRAVNKDLTNKEGQIYNAWIQMDFNQTTPNGNYKLKQYHQNYGFDIENALSAHPIKEFKHNEYKADLVGSLKKGNRQSATFINDGMEQKYHIEANPKFKTINIYDSNMQRLNTRQSKKEQQSEGETHTVKQQNRKEKQAADDDEPEMPKQAKKKRRKKAQSIS